MKLASVVLDINSANNFDSLYYLIDNKSSKFLGQIIFPDSFNRYPVAIGCQVLVPFKSRIVCGYIVDINEFNFDCSNNNICYRNVMFSVDKVKPIIASISNVMLSSEAIIFAKWISERYCASMLSSLKLFINTNNISKCCKKGDKYQVCFPTTKNKFSLNYETFPVLNDNNEKTLTNDQKYAFDLILHFVKSSIAKSVLIDGVTGSGKTEIYMQVISEVVRFGKNAIVLVPEISLTAQILSRFKSRFGDMVALLHSKMPKSNKNSEWSRIEKGEAKIVLGTRSALFSPIKNLGIIVIDEEHEYTYKQESSPRYVTRDCAWWLAKHYACPLVLGSATPSFESLYYCTKNKDWYAVSLKNRTNNKPMPKIDVVDMTQEFRDGRYNLFSTKLKKRLIDCVKAGNKAIILHNRRGFANYMFCRECGYIPTCKNCSTSLTYHERLLVEAYRNDRSSFQFKKMLKCHHCGRLEHVSATCPKCGSPYFAKLGAGTQSVEEQLNNLLNSNFDKGELPKIIRMDADTTRGYKGHEKCLIEFMQASSAILLGTQMIAKGLDFNNVSLVGVILADTMLSLPDFRAQERTFDLISQVAGRCGRDDTEGNVVVQTYKPSDPSIYYASKYDKLSFVNEQLSKRKSFNLPPYCRLVNIIVQSRDESYCKLKSEQFNNHIISAITKSNFNDIQIQRPSSCMLKKIRGQYRFHFYIKFPYIYDIGNLMQKIMSDFKKNNKFKIIVDIDAYSVL